MLQNRKKQTNLPSQFLSENGIRQSIHRPHPRNPKKNLQNPKNKQIFPVNFSSKIDSYRFGFSVTPFVVRKPSNDPLGILYVNLSFAHTQGTLKKTSAYKRKRNLGKTKVSETCNEISPFF